MCFGDTRILLVCTVISALLLFQVHLSGYLHSDELTAVKYVCQHTEKTSLLYITHIVFQIFCREIERQLRMDDISSGDGGMASTRAGLTSATSYCAAMDYLRAVLHQTKLLRVPVIFVCKFTLFHVKCNVPKVILKYG